MNAFLIVLYIVICIMLFVLGYTYIKNYKKLKKYCRDVPSQFLQTSKVCNTKRNPNPILYNLP